MKYIAKPNTWFKAGTEVELLVDCRPDGWDLGIFKGIRICENSGAEAGKPVGTEYLDEEDCSFDEFEIKED